LSINNDLTGDFTSKLAVYSPDGKTGYGVGSEITKEDLASLFTLNYDLTTNA
jgi:hypothetical protein